jgi:imidazole glycerol phosphate synthase glutamine amidotransferase subunit
VTRRVHIVDTGVANIASLLAAFRRLDCDPELTTQAATVDESPYTVLPGVGAFGPGMEMLESSGLVEPVRERVSAGRPTLAVCLGMQLLSEESEENPDADGLGLFDVGVERFPAEVRIPQFGWNEVVAGADCELLETGYAYFANSYCISGPPEGWAAARGEYGGSFVAAMERGTVLACQFHPELSGEWGHQLLGRWLERGR